MIKEPLIYQRDGLGWYVETAGKLEGPMDTCQDAQDYLKLIQMVDAARTEVVCLDRECM